ncbi:MAG: hypothetical protein JWL93_2678 [Hyphomicrobiales bacterium]|nr:hypothetical protein [Hyphomicrobiales bacterium]
MNAASAPVPNSKAAEQRAHEPSMEEILASIRRIIADDQVLPLSARSHAAAEPEPIYSSTGEYDSEDEPDHEPELRERAPLRAEPLRAETDRREFSRPPEPRADFQAPELRRAVDEVATRRPVTSPANPAAHGHDTRPGRAEPRAERPAPDFHSGLASIFSNDPPRVTRDPVPALAPRGETAPRHEGAARVEPTLRAEPSSTGPQLVASTVPARWQATSQPKAAVVYPLDVERARPGAERPAVAPAVEHEREAAAPSARNLRDDEARDNSRTAAPEASAKAESQSVDLMRDERRAKPVPQQPPVEAGIERLLSEEANASISSAFQQLSTSVALPDADVMESLTRDLLRPMLKQWLDDNLPVMVEKMVRAEIERVARGGR